MKNVFIIFTKSAIFIFLSYLIFSVPEPELLGVSIIVPLSYGFLDILGRVFAFLGGFLLLAGFYEMAYNKFKIVK